jgi:hypothetical protein
MREGNEGWVGDQGRQVRGEAEMVFEAARLPLVDTWRTPWYLKPLSPDDLFVTDFQRAAIMAAVKVKLQYHVPNMQGP